MAEEENKQLSKIINRLEEIREYSKASTMAINAQRQQAEQQADEAKSQKKKGSSDKERNQLLKAIAKATSKTIGGVNKAAGVLGSTLDKAGSSLANILKGTGYAAGGIGLALYGGTFMLDKIMEFDSKKVKDNIVGLLEIGKTIDEDGNAIDVFKEGGKLALILGGLGLGLAAFSVGAGAAVAIDKFSGDSKWAENIRESVGTLMLIGSDFKDAGTDFSAFVVGMMGLGTGLAFFGAGSAIAGLSEALGNFFSEEGYAQSIKDSVVTLLSIGPEFKKAGTDLSAFVVGMMGLGAGLAVFGGGAAIAGLAEGINNFVNKGDWAQAIKDSVVTLLSIGSHVLDHANDFVAFEVAMLGLSAGLVAFTFGATVAAGMDKVLDLFQSGNWAQAIKDNVVTLLSIGDEVLKHSSDFAAFEIAMLGISAGLIAFGGSQAVGGFLDAVGKLFGGGESPMDKILKLVERIDDFDRVSDALRGIATAFGDLGDSMKYFGDVGKGGVKVFDKMMKSLEKGDRAQALATITAAQGEQINRQSIEAKESMTEAIKNLTSVVQSNTNVVNNNTTNTVVNNAIHPDKAKSNAYGFAY